MGFSIGSNHKSFNVDQIMGKAEAHLEKAGKKVEKFASGLASKAEKFADKIKNFNDDDLKKLAQKLEKYSDKAVAGMKKAAISMLHKLDEMTGGAIKELCKEMDLPFPKKTISGQLKDFGKELLGKKDFKQLEKFANEVASELKKGFNDVKSDAKELKSDISGLAAQIKARYRPQVD